jgi:hypothetical protein
MRDSVAKAAQIKSISSSAEEK